MGDDKLTLGVKQAGRIQDAMRRGNWISEMVHQSTEGDLYEQFGNVVLGTHKIVEAPILRRLYPDETILVGATNGTEIIANAGDVFTGQIISTDLKNGGINNSSGVATVPTPAEVYELHRDVGFRYMFGSLNRDINNLCWEQGQIVDFCREHHDKLHPKWATFFLFKVEGKEEPFVANVYLDDGELRVLVLRFDYFNFWLAGLRYRVVVPQPKS